MAKSDVETIINYFNSKHAYVYKLENCSRSKAYSIKRAIDKQMNPHDRFCEVKYKKETQTAVFDIVS